MMPSYNEILERLHEHQERLDNLAILTAYHTARLQKAGLLDLDEVMRVMKGEGSWENIHS